MVGKVTLASHVSQIIVIAWFVVERTFLFPRVIDLQQTVTSSSWHSRRRCSSVTRLFIWKKNLLISRLTYISKGCFTIHHLWMRMVAVTALPH